MINLIEKIFREYPLAREIYKGILNRIFKFSEPTNGVKVMEEDWRNLIVLDACRYDYFKKNYQDYIEGNLQKVVSPGSYTIDWFKGTFGDKKYNNVVYISGNPYINSKGIKLEGFDATEHFYKIVDVWDKYWDKDTKTVHPKYVGKETRLARAKYPNKCLISHFMQPHFPYLTLGPLEEGLSSHVKRAREDDEEGEEVWTKKIRELVGKVGIKIFGEWRIRKITRILNLRPLVEIELVAKKFGDSKLRDLYEENLKIAMKEIEKTVKRLPGKIIVTADHGERLGENGYYSHPPWDESPYTKEVPWLDVKKTV